MILGWMTGKALDRTATAISSALGIGGRANRLSAGADQWARGLPEELNAHGGALAALFLEPNCEADLPERKVLRERIVSGHLPTTIEWELALIELWKTIRESVGEEAQGLFCVPFEKAAPHLKELAHVFHRAMLDVQEDGTNALLLRFERLESRLLVSPTSEQVLQMPLNDIDGVIKAGEPKLGLVLLDKMESENWTALTDEQRCNLQMSQGSALLAIGREEEAAKKFLTCTQQGHESSQSRAFEAFGKLLTGCANEAKELAQKVLIDAPTNPMALSVRIATDERTAAEIIPDVPIGGRDHAEVALSLANRALEEGSFGLAEDYGRKAVAAEPSWIPALETLACVLLGGQFSAFGSCVDHPSVHVDKRRASEACELLERAIEASEGRAPRQTALLVLKYALSLSLIGDARREKRAVEKAYSLAPEEPQVATRFAGMLSSESEFEKSFEILRGVVGGNGAEDNSVLVLAIGLSERAAVGDLEEALAALRKRVESAGSSDEFRSSTLSLLVDIAIQSGRPTMALPFVEKYGDASLSHSRKWTLLAELKLATRDLDAAKIDADAAIAAINVETPYSDRTRLASVLVGLQEPAKALAIWKEILPVDHCVYETGEAINAALAIGDDQFILEFGESLRSGGVFDRQVMVVELATLQKYNDLGTSIKLIQDFLRANPRDKEFSLRLSLAAIKAGQLDLAVFDVEALPGVEEVDVEMGRAVASVLRQGPEPELAVSYAYQLFRRFPDEAVAHKTMISILSPVHPIPVTLPIFDRVQPGVAVNYRLQETGIKECLIIEQAEQVKPSLGEVAPISSIAKNLIGKKVGDEFESSPGGMQSRKAVILEVIDSRVQRYRSCMDRYEARFPDDPFVWKFQMPTNLEEMDTKEALSPIFDSVDKRVTQVLEAEAMYGQYPGISMSQFARVTGHSVFEAYQHLASKEGIPIKCCLGNIEELNSARKCLEDGKVLVLDRSALAAAYVLDLPIEEITPPYLVTESSLQELRDYLASPIDEQTVIAKEDDKYVRLTTSKEAVESQHALLADFLKAVEGHCAADVGLSAAKLDSELRSTYGGVFGPSELDSIAICIDGGHALWTDDLAVGVCALEMKVSDRVWTQVVAGWMTGAGIRTVDWLRGVNVRLLRMQYRHTLIDAESVVLAGEDSTWKTDSGALGEALQYFSLPSTNRAFMVGLSAQVLAGIWRRTPAPAISQEVAFSVLDALGRREGGASLVAAVGEAVDHTFGVDLLGAAEAKLAIERWQLASLGKGLLLLPW